MSAVIAADEAAPAPKKAGKKKLILIVAVALVLVLAIGGGVVFWLKHKAAKAAEAEAEGGAEKVVKVDPHFVPVFLPLDAFVVNLADKEADRFAQIGITLELENASAGERLKVYMPAVRNAILLQIAGKTSQMLSDRAGKEKLAQEIMREAVRPLGIELPEPEPVTMLAPAEAGSAPAAPNDGTAPKEAGDGHEAKPAEAKPAKGKKVADKAGAEDEEDDADGEAPKAKGKGKKKAKEKEKGKGGDHDAGKSPIVHVHFSSFIIQ